ncbi:MAG: hypothetical protein SNJ84_04550 [Verrucomicrobiia bacterium]
MTAPNSSSTPSPWPGVIFALLGFGLFAALVVYVLDRAGTAPDAAYEEERALKRATALAEVRAADAARLGQAGWVDQAAGVAHIPIERAMELEVRALRRKPVQAGPEIQPAELAPSNVTPPPPPVPGT